MRSIDTAAIFRARRQQMPVEEIVSGIQSAAEKPLEKGITLPAEVYTNDEYFEWEADNVLRKDWLCLAHRSQIPEAGDFLKLDLFGEPLLVVHGKDGQFRTLSRVCPHRAMDIMPEGFGAPAEPRTGDGDCNGESACGHTRLFICPYHAWTFELDGGLKGSPEMQRAEGFCREENGLSSFRTEVWNGFIFVNLDGQAEPLASHFSEMTATLRNWGGLDDMRMIVQKTWECDFNWKVLFENFSECYHHIGAHAKTLQPLMPARECWTEEEKSAFIHEHLPLKESVAAELRQAMAGGVEFPMLEGLDHQRSHEWQIYLAPPCFMLFAGPNQVIWYRIDPLSTDRSRLLTTILVPKRYLALPQFEACKATAEEAMVSFHLEDMAMCTALQRGLYASAAKQGRLSHLEMPIWLFQRYLAARFRNTRPTVDRPAAKGQNGRVGPVPA